MQLDPHHPNQDRLVKQSEAKRFLPWSDVTFYRKEKSGVIEAVRIPGSNRRYYRLSDIMKLVEG